MNFRNQYLKDCHTETHEMIVNAERAFLEGLIAQRRNSRRNRSGNGTFTRFRFGKQGLTLGGKRDTFAVHP